MGLLVGICSTSFLIRPLEMEKLTMGQGLLQKFIMTTVPQNMFMDRRDLSHSSIKTFLSDDSKLCQIGNKTNQDTPIIFMLTLYQGVHFVSPVSIIVLNNNLQSLPWCNSCELLVSEFPEALKCRCFPLLLVVRNKQMVRSHCLRHKTLCLQDIKKLSWK